MGREVIVLDPVTENSANAPLVLAGEDGLGLGVVAHDYPTAENEEEWASSPESEGARRAHTKPANRVIAATLLVREPQGLVAATNKVINPRALVGTTGWTNSSLTTFERVASLPAVLPGFDTAIHAAGNADDDAAYVSAAVTNGVAEVFSAWVYVVSGTVRLEVWTAAPASFVQSANIPSGGWRRVSLPFTPNASATWTFRVAQNGAGTSDFYVTGVMVGPDVPFFDGDSPGGDWTGVRNASTSTRRGSGGAHYAAVINDVEAKVAKLNARGGTYRRTLPDGTLIAFDVLAARVVSERHDALSERAKTSELEIEFTCRPYGRGVSVMLSDHSETTLPVLVATETVPGDVPAEGQWVVDNDAASDWWEVILGMEDDFAYDISAASAALFYEAEGRTVLGGSSVVTGASGASGGGSNNVVRNTALTTSYLAVLSTQATGGGAHLTHVGTFRVYARVWVPTTNSGAVTVALEWAVGDFRRVTRNIFEATTLDATLQGGTYRLVDLGAITIPAGVTQWEGRVLAKISTVGSGTEQIDVDYLQIVPWLGEASAVPQVPAPTSFVARDEFTYSSDGVLTGQTAPVGGTWVGAGDADDFAVGPIVAFEALRTVAGADSANTGRWATVGSSQTATTVATNARSSALLDGLVGVVCRYTDANNWLMFGLEFATSQLVVKKRVSGTISTLFTAAVSLAANVDYSLQLSVDTQGRWWVRLDDQLVGSGRDAVLATGGGLASGTIGIYSEHRTTGMSHVFDDFCASTFLTDAAVYGGQSLRLTSTAAERENSSGTLWQPVSSYEGDLLRAPAGGRENRQLRFLVAPSFHDAATMPHDWGDMSARLTVTPRYLVVPRPA